jgi:hypothetical protein
LCNSSFFCLCAKDSWRRNIRFFSSEFWQQKIWIYCLVNVTYNCCY